MKEFAEALVGRLADAIFDLDFWQALLVFFIFSIAIMLRLAHKGSGNYMVTDILAVNGIASLKKHLCAGAWVIHTYVVLHQEASRDLSETAAMFYAFFWGGVYLLGPVFPAIAQAIVSKWAGVEVERHREEREDGTDRRTAS